MPEVALRKPASDARVPRGLKPPRGTNLGIDSRPMKIRPAESRDGMGVLALVPQLSAFGPPPWRDVRQMIATDERVVAAALSGLAPDSTVLVAEGDGGELLGFIHLRPETDYFTGQDLGHVADIVVAPEARGQGVGRALMEAAEAWARERGHPMLTLNVFVENAAARALYERLGYQAELIKYVKDLR